MDFAVLIPAFRPAPPLLDLVRDLAARGVSAILVVDDGSGPEFATLFEQAAALPKVTLLRHDTNLGKGAALKTGMEHVLRVNPEVKGVVTADADGQHHPEDIQRVADALLAHPDSLVLGCRNFEGAVPLRSRFGNMLTRVLMRMLVGSRLSDTQTGLRGIPRALLAKLPAIEARGYEFELEMLIAAHRLGVPLVEIPIRTIYEAGNRSSHFNPLVDSMKIYFVLLRFASVSILTALLDNLIFYFLWRRIGIAQAQMVARAAAVIFNYSMVRRKVFFSREAHQTVLPKYLMLVAASGTTAYFGIRFLTAHFGIATMPAKLLVETLLFFANFAVQRMLIFRGDASTNGRFAGRLILLAVAALVVVEGYGLGAANLFHVEVWAPEDPWRVVQFAAVFAAYSTAVLILVPWIFARLCIGAVIILTAIIAGPQALLATAVFFLAALCLGSLVEEVWGRRSPSVVCPASEARLPALLLGISLYIFLMPFAARLPINYPAVYLAAMAIPIALRWRVLRGEMARLLCAPAAIDLRTWAERASFAVLVLLLAVHWLAALQPERSADGLSMHLAVPMNIAAHHAMTFDPARFVWAAMPMGADFVWTLVYLPGGEFATHLVNFVTLVVLLGVLYSLARRWVSRGVAYFLLALFVSTPMVHGLATALFVENLLAALLLGAVAALWRFGDRGDRRFVYVAAVLAGTALSTKLGALPIIAVALPFAAYELRRAKLPARARWAAAALLLVTAAPPYAIAWAKTGNPLFPFLNKTFHSSLLPADADIRNDMYRQPVAWSTPYTLTFETNRYYEGRNGSFGFQYLALAPLALLTLLVAARRQTVAAAVISLGASLLILRAEPNARYLYPALPLLYLPCAALLEWAAAHARLLYGFLLATIAACLALNSAVLPSQGYYYTLYPPGTEAGRAVFLKDIVVIRGVIDWFNRAHPGAPVLLTQDSFIAGLQGEVYENHWHQFNTQAQLQRADDVAAVRRLLDEWHVRYMIARVPSVGHYARPKALRRLLDNCTVTEYAHKEFYVARVETHCDAPSIPETPELPTVTAGRGVYDDFDPQILFTGDWERGDQFVDAFHGTITYNNAPGATAMLAFSGADVTWVFTRAFNRGIATVTIDGMDKGSYDLYSKDTQWRQRTNFLNLGPGRHLLVIRVTGRHSPGATDSFVDVDSLEVR